MWNGFHPASKWFMRKAAVWFDPVCTPMTAAQTDDREGKMGHGWRRGRVGGQPAIWSQEHQITPWGQEERPSRTPTWVPTWGAGRDSELSELGTWPCGTKAQHRGPDEPWGHTDSGPHPLRKDTQGRECGDAMAHAQYFATIRTTGIIFVSGLLLR